MWWTDIIMGCFDTKGVITRMALLKDMYGRYLYNSLLELLVFSSILQGNYQIGLIWSLVMKLSLAVEVHLPLLELSGLRNNCFGLVFSKQS
jgi:hypothetical protein